MSLSLIAPTEAPPCDYTSRQMVLRYWLLEHFRFRQQVKLERIRFRSEGILVPSAQCYSSSMMVTIPLVTKNIMLLVIVLLVAKHIMISHRTTSRY